MPSAFNVVSAVLLPALILCAPTESPAGDASGEEAQDGGQVGSDLLSTWKVLADRAKQHSKEFENEFQINATMLDSYKSSSFPVKCPETNFSKEACFQRLAEGLLTYTVLLKHVEKEYPNITLLSAAKLYSPVLIQQIKDKMRHGDRVAAPTADREAQLLKEFNRPSDNYHRRMTAHSVLHHLRKFLADGKRAIYKREKAKGKTEPTFYNVLKR